MPRLMPTLRFLVALATLVIAGLMTGAAPASAAPPTCVTPPAKDVRVDTLATFVPDCGILFGSAEYYSATYEITTPPQHGTARVARDISTFLRYVPPAGYTGPDSFSYRVVTAGGVSPPVTQAIEVAAGANVLPTCSPGAPGLKLRAGVARDVTLSCSDADGDPLTIEIVTDPDHATVGAVSETDAARTVTLTPEAGFSGADDLAIRASDGRGVSPTVTIPWTVVPAGTNTAPTCSAPMSTPVVNRDTPGGFSTWCQDAEGDPVGLEVTVAPAHGVAEDSPAVPLSPMFPILTLRYTPADGYTGPDSVTFRPRDAQGAAGAPVTVSLTVAPPPSPLTPFCVPASQLTVRAGVTARGALGCFFAQPGGPELITAPSHGSVVLSDTGYRYTPAPGYTGADSFSYRVLSAGGAGPVVTQPVLVVAGANTVPGCSIAFSGRGFLNYEEPVVRMGSTAPVRVSCHDADGDVVVITGEDPAHAAPLGFAPISALEPWEDPERTTAVAGTYAPDPGFAGFDTVRVAGNDSHGGSTTAEAVVAVRTPAYNSAPWCDSMPASSPVLVAGGEIEYREFCRDREGDPVSLDIIPPAGITASPVTRDGDFLRAVLGGGAGVPGWRTFLARAVDDRGDSIGPMTRSLRVVAPEPTVDRQLGRGESAGAQLDELPTPARPVSARVTILNEGRVTIATASGSAPAGYSAFGQTFTITAPEAIPEAPLALRFRFDASLLAGVSLADVVVFRNGTAVLPCTGAGAAPNPCVASRMLLRDGDAEIFVRTVRASTWSFGRALGGVPAGTDPPVGGQGPQRPVGPSPQTLGGGGEAVLQPPTIKPRVVKLGAALSRGIGVTVASPFSGTARAILTLDGKAAKRLKLSKGKVITVARGSTPVRAGKSATLTARFTKRARKALRKSRSVRLTLRVAVGDGPPATRTITLKR